jgi:hypothetical protein
VAGIAPFCENKENARVTAGKDYTGVNSNAKMLNHYAIDIEFPAYYTLI